MVLTKGNPTRRGLGLRHTHGMPKGNPTRRVLGLRHTHGMPKGNPTRRGLGPGILMACPRVRALAMVMVEVIVVVSGGSGEPLIHDYSTLVH